MSRTKIRITPGFELEREPGESVRKFGWRARQEMRVRYVAWMEANLRSLADFELELELLADRARRVKHQDGVVAFIYARRMRQLRAELRSRTELGEDLFRAHRPDLVAKVERIKAAASSSSSTSARMRKTTSSPPAPRSESPRRTAGRSA